MDEYVGILARQAILASYGKLVDPYLFRNSMKESIPHLTAVALRDVYAATNSTDAERSFSLYNLVFSERRKSLSEKSI